MLNVNIFKLEVCKTFLEYANNDNRMHNRPWCNTFNRKRNSCERHTSFLIINRDFEYTMKMKLR